MRKGLLKFMAVILVLAGAVCFTACTSASATDKPSGEENADYAVSSQPTDDTVSDVIAISENETNETSETVPDTTTDTDTIYTDERFEHSVSDADKPVWPVYGMISRAFTENHTGIDIAAKPGEKIYAAEDGVVSEAVYSFTGNGIYCVIEHDGYSTLYAHCSELRVEKEQEVKKGELIAYVGSTGNSTGPHLHFEIQQNGSAVDPYTIYE